MTDSGTVKGLLHVPIRALTFDLDDTLWPAEPLLSRAEHRMERWLHRHFPAITRRYDRAALRELRHDMARLHPHLCHDVTALRKEALRWAARSVGCSEQAVDSALEVFLGARNRVALYADVPPVLRRLHSSYPLAVITNGNADIRRIGLHTWFAFAVAAGEVGSAKPRSAIYEAACSRFQIPAAEIAHVGDDLECDVSGARAAGLVTVWLNRSGKSRSADVAPHAKITTLFELEPLIKGWNGRPAGDAAP